MSLHGTLSGGAKPWGDHVTKSELPLVAAAPSKSNDISLLFQFPSVSGEVDTDRSACPPGSCKMEFVNGTADVRSQAGGSSTDCRVFCLLAMCVECNVSSTDRRTVTMIPITMFFFPRMDTYEGKSTLIRKATQQSLCCSPRGRDPRAN
jgi:hypothetical protein